jgi:hypothetical protein
MALITTLNSVTRDVYLPTLRNNFYKRKKFLSYLNASKLKQNGGANIDISLEYAGGALATGYHKGTTPNTNTNDASTNPEFITTAKAPWKHLKAHVWMSYIDDLKNAAEGQIIDLAAAKMKAAEKVLRKELLDQIFAAAADGDDYISGLPDAIINTDPSFPTGGFEGITVSDGSWWKAVIATYDHATESLVTKMQNAFDSCQIYGDSEDDMPDLIVTTQAVYEEYLEEALQKTGILRDTGEKTADLGFVGATFAGGTVPVIWDPRCIANKMYFLNRDYLQLLTHSRDDFEIGEGWTTISGSRDIECTVYWTGNLICSKRAALSVLTRS